ncbi:hypothetical protein E1287_31185 [Actinomadura sp. KC06]|uniref:hypothetical protein n=1 Tax=Actinomadura sp. KC06 TaxID=2530369 RepID=UPI0010474678|nr:hypothetical protein [Actinomadura sp. KC06]TDD29271.1 hypothetical protein E1287_31185 [Actinomadura sp. KC06]
MRPAGTTSHAAAKAELERDFPGWRVLVSDRRRWWALRGPLPFDQVNEVDVVDADTPEALRTRLSQLAPTALEAAP